MSAFVQANSKVLGQLTITLADGSLVESSQQGKPTLFCLGDGSLSALLEQQLLGLTAGATHQFSLPASAVFGDFNPDLLRHFSRLAFNQLAELEVGMIILFDEPTGGQRPGLIQQIVDDSVTVDFNHPLIGETLYFQLAITSIENPAIEADYANFTR